MWQLVEIAHSERLEVQLQLYPSLLLGFWQLEMEPPTSSFIYKMNIFAVLTTKDIVRLKLPLQITKTFTSWTINLHFLFLAPPKGPTAPKLLHIHSLFSLSAFNQQVTEETELSYSPQALGFKWAWGRRKTFNNLQ